MGGQGVAHIDIVAIVLLELFALREAEASRYFLTTDDGFTRDNVTSDSEMNTDGMFHTAAFSTRLHHFEVPIMCYMHENCKLV
jgi:hypothetical protein